MEGEACVQKMVIMSIQLFMAISTHESIIEIVHIEIIEVSDNCLNYRILREVSLPA